MSRSLAVWCQLTAVGAYLAALIGLVHLLVWLTGSEAVGAGLAMLTAWLLLGLSFWLFPGDDTPGTSADIRSSATRDERGRIIPPQGGSGTAPPRRVSA
jgi:hypothetical protein